MRKAKRLLNGSVGVDPSREDEADAEIPAGTGAVKRRSALVVPRTGR